MYNVYETEIEKTKQTLKLVIKNSNFYLILYKKKTYIFIIPFYIQHKINLTVFHRLFLALFVARIREYFNCDFHKLNNLL